MPKRGAYGDLDDLSGARRELTAAIRGLCKQTELALHALAKECHSSKSAVSDLINGKRRNMDEGLMWKVYALAEAKAGADALRCSRDFLGHLLQRVKAEDQSRQPACKRCGRQLACDGCSRLMAQVAFPAETIPAEHGLARPPARHPEPDTTLPVMPQGEDRQHATQQIWQGFDDLNARLAAGEVSDAVGILRHTGMTAPAAEAAAAITACRRGGLHDAANAIVAYAAQRGGRDIMEIMQGLILNEDQAGATELLGLALAKTSA